MGPMCGYAHWVSDYGIGLLRKSIVGHGVHCPFMGLGSFRTVASLRDWLAGYCARRCRGVRDNGYDVGSGGAFGPLRSVAEERSR